MKVDDLAKKVWDYMVKRDELKKVDAILVLGSKESSPAKYACELFLQGFAEYLIFSGGVKFSETKTEAEEYFDIAIKMGVPKEKIIVENKATNTGENFSCTAQLLKSLNLDFQSFILVQKPYMMRRTFATGKVQWQNKELLVSCENISYEDFLKQSLVSKEDLINTMVGDLQRIKIYPEKGFQIYQEIPEDVWEVGQELISLGFHKRLAS